VISERLKYIQYQQIWSNTYFWRTHDQQEIDYIEERDGQLHAYEIKWNPVRKVVPSKSFTNSYPVGKELLAPEMMTFTVVSIILFSVAISLLIANLAGIPQSTSQSVNHHVGNCCRALFP
jgi:short subunit dehydrogenase-like uncharacterized protein